MALCVNINCNRMWIGKFGIRKERWVVKLMVTCDVCGLVVRRKLFYRLHIVVKLDCLCLNVLPFE